MDELRTDLHNLRQRIVREMEERQAELTAIKSGGARTATQILIEGLRARAEDAELLIVEALVEVDRARALHRGKGDAMVSADLMAHILRGMG